MRPGSVGVWDRAVRVLHWSLVVAVGLAAAGWCVWGW